jgi:DNA repair exonuclease SbcCD ATPase subunit
MSKLCNDCAQTFAQHYSLDKLNDEITDFESKRSILSEKLNEQQVSKDEKQKEHDSINVELSNARASFKDMTAEYSKHIQQMTSVNEKLASCNANIDKLNSQHNPYEDMLKECKTNIEDEEHNMNSYDTKLKYLKYAESIVSQDTLRKFIIKDLVVLLNNKIKTYLTRLGAQYYVEFDEDMDYEFITRSGSCEWSNFSAGERMRIMIATSFAFRDFMSIRNGLNANILVLDEYFDSAIDTLCVENIISILKEYSTTQHQNIFVISHRPEVNIDQFDRIIQVEKTNGIAHTKIMQ